MLQSVIWKNAVRGCFWTVESTFAWVIMNWREKVMALVQYVQQFFVCLFVCFFLVVAHSNSSVTEDRVEWVYPWGTVSNSSYGCFVTWAQVIIRMISGRVVCPSKSNLRSSIFDFPCYTLRHSVAAFNVDVAFLRKKTKTLWSPVKLV